MSTPPVNRTTSHLSRRSMLKLGTGIVGLVGIATITSKIAMRSMGVTHADATTNTASLTRAFQFQDLMMDLYATGSAPRLSQSYSDQQNDQSSAFIYDNALMIIAYLGQPEGTGLARAKALGDGLLYAQQHDPVKDGRLRQAYLANPFILADGSLNMSKAPFNLVGSAVGDLAWAGLALAHLFVRTQDKKYLQGAQDLAQWIYTNAYDTRGAGGYTLGADNKLKPLPYKSTEHNIDVYAFFSILAQLTNNQDWSSRAQHAQEFIKAMWNSTDGYFYAGTGDDGATINTGIVPEDIQTWSYLALRDNSYAASIDWAVQHLASADTAKAPQTSLTGDQSFSGVTFSSASLTSSSANPNAVWFEGTAHTALALRLRNKGTDGKTAERYLSAIQSAQTSLGKSQTANNKALSQGLGIVATSSILDTGLNFNYNPNLHIGATAWYCMASLGINPYQAFPDQAIPLVENGE